MIVVMKKGASTDQVEHMVRRVEELGLKSHVIVGTERTVIAAVGEKREHAKESLESGPGVAEVVPILAPYKVASREVKPEPTVVQAGSLTVGGGQVGVIAGPCSVESEQADHRHGSGRQGGRGNGPAGRGLQAAHQSLQLPGAEGRGSGTAGGGTRGHRAGRGYRGHRRRGCAAGRPLCRRAADRRAQHAELPAVGGGRQQSASRCCSNAAPAPRWTSCCWRPSTSSTRAIRT